VPRFSTAFLALAVILLPACADLAAPPDAPDFLPPPDPSLDPSHVVVGEMIATPCQRGVPGGFDDLLARDEWALVDVYFARSTAADPHGPPSLADMSLVWRHGGTLLHAFSIPAVRARMQLSRVPGLVAESGQWIIVRSVPDPTRYDVPLIVGFTRGLSDADVTWVESLGGQVTHRWDVVNALVTNLPDRSIPVLLASPDVDHAQPVGVYCLA
jgi:hypothetical protein